MSAPFADRDLDPASSLFDTLPEADETAPPGPSTELAASLAARLCHDLISPASAIVSGVDLLEDPTQEDLKDDALNLIGASARKLVALLAFARVAFGASASAETFDTAELKRLAASLYEHVRAQLDWQVTTPTLGKPAARAILNMAQIGATALPTGGVATARVSVQDGVALISVDCESPRARLRPEVLNGLKGLPAGDGGLHGHWVQAFYLHALLREAGGGVDATVEDGRVVLRARAPE